MMFVTSSGNFITHITKHMWVIKWVINLKMRIARGKP